MTRAFALFATAVLTFAVTLAAAPREPAHPPAPAPEPQTHALEQRLAHIRGALLALGDRPVAELLRDRNNVGQVARGACAAGTTRLRVECLLVAMGRICRERGAGDSMAGNACLVALDVIATNALADERLIPPARRYQITRESADYRKALAEELRRIQGNLAVDFRLKAEKSGASETPSAMAENVDAFCRAQADDTNLAYQACVASLVWFVAVEPRLEKGQP
jgi:hypothetical protein